MKKYQTAKELLATKAENKEKKPIYATRKLSIGLVSCMLGLLMAAPIARAEELPPSPGVEAAGQKEAPAKVEEDLLTEAEINEIKDRALNLGDDKYIFTTYRVDELKERLRKIKAENPDNFAQLKKEAIDKAIIEFIPPSRGEDREIQGFKIVGGNKITTDTTQVKVEAYGVLKGYKIKLLVNDEVRDTFEQTKGKSKTSKTTATMQVGNLNVGDKIKAIVYDSTGKNPKETPVYTVEKAVEKKDKTLKDKLNMPEGEIWIEDTAASLPDDIEKKKAEEMFWEKNVALKNDIESVDFSINGTTNAYYEVTFDDGSKLKVEAANLKIKNPTEITPQPEIQQTFVADGNIVIKLKQKVPKGTAYGIVRQFDTNESNKGYCKGTCKLDKTSVKWDTLKEATDTITYSVDKNFLQYGQEFGVVVKEYGKKSSCQSKSPEIKIPELIGVRDPKNLTEEEKKAIDAAIRKANTRADGASKLPDWTAYNIPAIIDIDNEGNVTIVNPSNVEEDSNEGGTEFKPKRKPDGSLQMKTGKENSRIPIANTKIIENKEPDKPKIELSDDKKTITVTPNPLDTDATEVSVTYTPEGETTPKTITVKKDPTDNKWKLDPAVVGIKVDEGTGKITINTSLVKGGTNVYGSVKDAGFPEKSKDKDKEQKVSDNGQTVFKKADKLLSIGELAPVVMKKWVGETPNWKDGVKVKDGVSAENKKKIDDLLAGATYDDFQDDASKAKRNTDSQGDFEGTIKVTFDDDSFIKVEKQMLYVSNHVTSTERKDKVPTGALDVEFKLGEGVKVDNTDGTTKEGNKTNPVSYAKYKVKPGTNLKTYTLPVVNQSVVASIKLQAKDKYTNPVWNDNGQVVNDFTVNANKVFIATATSTEKFTVTVKPNGGTKAGGGDAEDIVTNVKKNGTYKLPAANTFNPPNENQEFSGWMVGDDTNLKKPNTEITINGNTEIKAIWKPIEYKVRFNSGGGSGNMNEKTVTKGSEFELPENGFTAPTDKKFAGWSISGITGVHQAGKKIQISGDVTITATWKPKSPGTTPGSGSGTGTGETTTPGTTPEPSQPGNTPGTTPGSENPTGDNPTDPAKDNPDQKDKPEDKKTGEDNKNNPKTPNVEKGDKVINVGDKEVVVPKVVVDKKKGKLDKEERTKIAEKIKQKNPDVVDVKIDENANAYVTFNDGRRERIPAKDLLSKEGFMIPRRDRHSQDESPNRRRAGKNVKTGVESIAGIACTLVASTGALYIGRKKED